MINKYKIINNGKCSFRLKVSTEDILYYLTESELDVLSITNK